LPIALFCENADICSVDKPQSFSQLFRRSLYEILHADIFGFGRHGVDAAWRMHDEQQ
jgi:hypothetical protein